MIKLSDFEAPRKLLITEYINLAADTGKDYDLQMLAGANHALYDLPRALVIIRAKDTVAESPTLNAYINAEAAVIHGVVSENTLRIHNHFNSGLDFYVSIEVPRKPL